MTVGEVDRAGADDADTVTRRTACCTDDGGAVKRGHATDVVWLRGLRVEDNCVGDGNEGLVGLELVGGA